MNPILICNEISEDRADLINMVCGKPVNTPGTDLDEVDVTFVSFSVSDSDSNDRK